MKLQTVRACDGAVLVPLRDGEMAELLRVSAGRSVDVRFGSGGTALVSTDSPWALPLLSQWRGIAFVDGAGI